MPDVTASRTLVKSHPELWTECSDAGSLARHLGQFGAIRITRLEPETAVAWEGELASGTVRLEPSGWGTRVVLTATPAPAPEPVAAPAAAPELAPEPVAPAGESEPMRSDPPAVPEPARPAEAPEPAAAPELTASPRRGLLARLLGALRRPAVGPAPEMAPDGPPAVEASPDSPPPAAQAPPPLPAPASGAPPGPACEPPPAPACEPPQATVPDPADALAAALDSLGQAHHRPFSRS